jgi:hypothetical protein
LLARGGRSAGVFGSLHSSSVPAALDNYAFYVPDFFADEAFAHPPELQPFQRFNLVMTRRSARNVTDGIPARAAAAFLRQYLRQGFNWSTLRRSLAVLHAGRRHPHLKGRRRSLQPLLGLDVFAALMRRAQPDFATFYTNHVAANMHRFWAAAFPDDAGENQMPTEWRRDYAGEIEFSMQVLDEIFARLRVLAEASDSLLVAAGSIGQAAVRATPTNGFVTITDLDRFMSRLGLSGRDWKRKPTMVPSVSVLVDPLKADAFEARLRTLVVDGHGMQKMQRELPPISYDRAGSGSFQLFIYFEGRSAQALAASVDGEAAAPQELGLGFFSHDEKVACSGRHTPFGALLVYDPRRSAASSDRSTVSTLELAPALLRHFGIAPRDYMTRSDSGLLDVTIAKARSSRRFHGGGVETPVSRAGEAWQPGDNSRAGTGAASTSTF